MLAIEQSFILNEFAVFTDLWFFAILWFHFYGFDVYYVNFVGNINIDDKLIDNLKCASNIYCFFGDMEILS